MDDKSLKHLSLEVALRLLGIRGVSLSPEKEVSTNDLLRSAKKIYVWMKSDPNFKVK